ncbi:GP5 protein [DeBrazza's monkey arterivirus]|uniref:GP5 protein n=1 Tax=DeBrazza's monkey arterivirus TaxID=1965063 RepID=A0A0B6CCJ5_9NIDO|nr:GP5 protein [DeBrazza's monkey arterivirus]AJI43734.1 GP5 protein [DeBrazza's monkey arterivirus]
MKCYVRSERSSTGTHITSALSTFLLLCACCVSTFKTASATDVGGFSSNSTLWSSFKNHIISDSYVVNISICGALDISNNTHWLTPCNYSQFKQDCLDGNGTFKKNENKCNHSSCFLQHYTGQNINYTRVILETYLATPLFTHLLSYYAATTAAGLDFLYFAGLALTAVYYQSPAFLTFSPLALIFLVVFVRRLVLNCMALRYAWTRHTNFIIDQNGRLFVNHDDVLIADKDGVKVGSQKVKVAKVILGGREACLLRQAHVEEWTW